MEDIMSIFIKVKELIYNFRVRKIHKFIDVLNKTRKNARDMRRILEKRRAKIEEKERATRETVRICKNMIDAFLK